MNPKDDGSMLLSMLVNSKILSSNPMVEHVKVLTPFPIGLDWGITVMFQRKKERKNKELKYFT